MKVPNCWDAEISRNKIADYLLCLEHPEGGPKARFFISWGFSPQEENLFASSLIKQNGLSSIPACSDEFLCRPEPEGPEDSIISLIC